MKKVLIAVDGTKDSKSVLSAFHNLEERPEDVVLLYVERLEGNSLMIDMLGEAEMSTLKDSLKGTDYKEALDRKAEKILNYYERELGVPVSKSMVREGIPAEEILKVSEEEGVELIFMGENMRKGLDRLITGSVARIVEKNAKVPVFVARTDNRVTAGVEAIFFLFFVAAVIYWSSVVLMNLVERYLSSSVYIGMLAGIMFAGIIMSVIGARLGWRIGNIVEKGIIKGKSYRNLFELLKY